MSHRPQDSPEPAGAYPPGWRPNGPPTPPRNDKLRWILGLGALVAVVAVAAVLLVTGRDSGTASSADAPYVPKTTLAPAPRTSGAPSSLASAGDTGPVAIITSDETCGPWDNVQTAVAAAQKNGWADRDASVPASEWDPTRRSQFEAVGNALRSGADTAVTLAARTPHRAMRELYDAFIVYGRAYADALPAYQPGDDLLAQTSLAALDSITNVCAANRSISAMAQVPGVPPAAPPANQPTVGDTANPERFLPQASPTCARWIPDAATLRAQTQDWAAIDPNIGVAQWSSQQRAVADDAARVLATRADTMVEAARTSNNAVVEDLATLGALYFRAFAMEEPLYWPGVHDLADVGFTLNDLVSVACQAGAA